MFKAEGISCMKMYEIYTIVIVIGTVVLMDLKCFFRGMQLRHPLLVTRKPSAEYGYTKKTA